MTPMQIIALHEFWNEHLFANLSSGSTPRPLIDLFDVVTGWSLRMTHYNLMDGLL